MRRQASNYLTCPHCGFAEALPYGETWVQHECTATGRCLTLMWWPPSKDPDVGVIKSGDSP